MIATVLGAGALALLVALVLLRRWVTVVSVSGSSMAPTLQPGDRLVVRRVPAHRLRTGSIVVIDEPGPCRPGDLRRKRVPRWVVKRVVGVPGEPVPAALAGLPSSRQSVVRPGVVPPGHVLLLGDNAEHSRDSRHYGPAGTHRVLGVVLRRLGGDRLADPPTPAGSGRRDGT